MRVTVVLGLLVACGGDGGSDTGDGTTDTLPTGEVCGELPQYDLPSLSCEQLADAFETSLDAADGCVTADDCTVVRAECEHWMEVACWYPVNPSCMSSDKVSEFNSEAGGCPATQVCQCGAEPEVDCIGGTCQFVGTY